MKRPAKNQASQVTPGRRNLRIESLEDRKLMTVATELVQMPQESQIGSEHWPEPAAEIAVEKVTNGRQGFFSRGLHNNGAFREPTGHILWNTADDAGTSSNSYTDSGRITYYAYELKNVQVTSVVDQESNLHNNGAFRSKVARENSFMAGIPSCPEFQAGADIVMEELEHGPGLHDSVHCLTGQHDRPGQSVEKLGGQESEPVTDLASFSHNPEWLRSQEIVGGTMCSARSSNDPVFFSHHANVDKIFSEDTLGGQESETVATDSFSLNFEEIKVTLQDVDEDEDVVPSLGDEDESGVADPRYTEDEQGGPADPLNALQSGTEDQEDEDDESSDDDLREVVERLIEVLDII
ncbi:MAG: tyrosinase family protein [Planctomycetota bacterium]|nr:tyrosinase family protein [Planctomycetota bacterium]